MGQAGEAFETPIVTVDLILFALGERALQVLLMRRSTPPASG